MIKNFCLVLTLACLLACSYTLEVQASAGYKDYNKAVFDALNKARKSPSTYKAYAEKEQKSFVYDSAGAITRSLCKDSTFTEKSTTCSKKEETNMGQSRWIDAVAFLGSQLPKPELKWDESLSQACYDHIQAQGPTGDVGNSANGQVLQVRADSYVMGMNYGMAYAYMDVSYPEDPILRAIIGDRGDDFRGGRQGIFSDSVTRAGVSCGCHKLYGEMCCILTANVMEDKNPSLVAKSAPQLSTCAAYTETTTDTTGAIFTLNSIDGTSTTTSTTSTGTTSTSSTTGSTSSTGSTGSTSTTGSTGSTSSTGSTGSTSSTGSTGSTGSTESKGKTPTSTTATCPPTITKKGPCPKTEILVDSTSTTNPSNGMVTKEYKITYTETREYTYSWTGMGDAGAPDVETLKKKVGITE